jgi:outer membrane protein assembly factor BamB
VKTVQFVACGMLLAAAPMVVAADWTHFRGNGSAVSQETGLPVKWGKDQGLRWKAELPGRGLSGVVVAGGRAYVTACDGPEQSRLYVLCFDAKTGAKLWQRSIWSTGGTNCHPKTSMAAPTPVADGRAIYALFATADLVAYDTDGNLLWYRSLTGDYPSITNQVGMAASPILAPGALIVPMDNCGESFLAGIDLKTGKNLWKADRPRDINWVTPAIRTTGGKTEIVFQGKEELVAYDAGTGQRRWSYAGEGGRETIPSPIVGPDGEVFTPGSDLVALMPSEEGQTPKVLWKTLKLKGGGYPTPLIYQGRVYALHSSGILTCGDAKDGKELWKERVKGPIAASPVAGDGRIYIVNEKGLTSVVKLGDKPEIESQNDLADDILATPAIADGAIYMRSDKFLYCIGSK